VLHYWDGGSRSRHSPNVALYQITIDGFVEIKRWTNLPQQWALSCRDEIANLIAEPLIVDEINEEISNAIILLEQNGYQIIKL